MSALQRLQANEDDAIWRQNASTIRQLYQEERKTLKQVKAIMENEKGFPVTPLPTWEIKLRGLGMQKKLKARDWSLVYQHVRPRLQHEGKKKLRKPTAILINDTKKHWDDVWKEIRRNHALSQRRSRGPLPPLPPGVVIRTPSPELFEATIRRQQSMSPHNLSLQLFQATLVSLQPLLLESDFQSKAELSDTLRYADSVYKLCLEGIPFTRMLEEMSGTILPSALTVARLEESQDGQITPAFRPPGNLTVAGRPTSWKSQLTGIIAQLLPGPESPTPNGQDLGPNFDSHYYLSMVIYLLSNNLVSIYADVNEYEVSISEILRMTFTFVPRRLLMALLQSRQPSVRATWEKLLRGAALRTNEEAFRVLITIGMDNDWLDEHYGGYDYLLAAVQMGCSDVLHALLGRGYRPVPYPLRSWGKSIVVEALKNGNLDCAKLLIQHCDVNYECQARIGGRTHKSTNFVDFIVGFDDTKADHLHCLSLFLEKGPDVDYEVDPNHRRSTFHEYWHRAIEGELKNDWPLSILDYVYYFHRPLFPKLAMYSKVPSRFSRARALWLLEQGVDVFRTHLAFSQGPTGHWEEASGRGTNRANVPERKHHFLGVLFAEQLLLSEYSAKKKLTYRILQSLLELELDLTWLSKKKRLADGMLYKTACLITSGESPGKEHGIQILRLLLDQGFQVQEGALENAVEDRGVTILECLARHCSDLKKYGAHALFAATSRNNFEATTFLLNGGVDPNSTFDFDLDWRQQTRSVLAAVAAYSSLAMTQYVVQRCAIRGNWEQGGHFSEMLMDIFAFANRRIRDVLVVDLFLKVQYIIEGYITASEPSCPSASLLESCIYFSRGLEDRRRIFEYLLTKGAKLRPGSPLAGWIDAGGGHRLVREMLDAGADPDAYSFGTNPWKGRNEYGDRCHTPLQAAAGIGDYTLVCLLLERGADLNRPELNRYSNTALQAICAWDPVRPEEVLRKDKIIKLFLDEGADVNAENSPGHTALFHAAQLGDLSTAFILLKHGAKVDAICEPAWVTASGLERLTALDVAAINGRLDMAEFLLNANALSSSAYSGGKHYDGAIQYAFKNGHFAVAELIRKHSADRQREWAVEHEPPMETIMPRDHETQPPVPQGDPRTTHSLVIDRRRTPGEDVRDIMCLNKNDDVRYDLHSGMFDSSKVCPEAKEKSTTGAEASVVGWTRVIEEFEDEPLLADHGLEEATEEKSDRTANQHIGTWDASSGNGGGLYQPGGQDWDQDEQQSVELCVSKSLAEDVFMGFSESPSL